MGKLVRVDALRIMRHLSRPEVSGTLSRPPSDLRAEDLANAWAYARAHADEIERQVRENEAD